MSRVPNLEVIRELRERINSGRYNHIGFLPSERNLAEELGVGRSVIRSVLQVLQEERLIRIVPQRGVCICTDKQPRRLQKFMVCHQRKSLKSAYELLGIMTGICDHAAELFAEVILSFADSQAEWEEITARCRRGEIQGVIFIESPELPETWLSSSGIPCVIANQENDWSDVVCTRMDLRSVGRMAGTRLVRAGHRVFGVLGGDFSLRLSRELLAGFRGALAEDEITLDPRLVLSTIEPDCHEKLRAVLTGSEPPTAWFALRDHRAALLFQCARELNLSIPGDFSVIGYDDISWPGSAQQGLTTVAQPVDQIGREAVALLNDWVLTGTAPAGCTVSGTLVERSSVRSIL